MYEHHRQPLLPRRRYLRRLAGHFALSSVIIGGSLALGMVGYRCLAAPTWTDAYLDASMILSGMGPVDRLDTTAAKLFAGTYALFSGVVFISAAAILTAPVLHRILHRLHLCD